jgi:hypothetical protein
MDGSRGARKISRSDDGKIGRSGDDAARAGSYRGLRQPTRGGVSMQRINRTAARVLVTALVAGAVAAALGGVSLARAGGGDRTMTVTEVQRGATFVDISHTQNGAPGDQAVFRSVIKNAKGERIGTSDVICEEVLGHRLLCNGVYHLPGGMLTGTTVIAADEASTATIHVAITGGTGRYDQASGQVTTTPKSETVSRSVIDLD